MHTDVLSRIRQLPPGVVNKIAAGEVIERPASAVKELLENAVDALATRIEVDIEQGGAELIRVTDNGEGIHPDDLELAVASHATSKLASADDLFNVKTMGFRGEALASIAEISHFCIRSRTADQLTGAELEVRGGEQKELRACGAPQGTRIEVRQLFFNTPVRRKFLKTPATEFAHIAEQFTRVALPNPSLHMTLRHNGRTVHDLPATSDVSQRIELFFGTEVAQSLIPVDATHGQARVWGFVAHPSQNKATRKGQYLFLNGRWIQDRSLQHALGEAYRGLVMVGRYPVAFLFLELPPDQVDVNVHPTKVEVRFQDSQVLYRLLLSTIRNRFLSMDLDSRLSVEPAGRSPSAGAGSVGAGSTGIGGGWEPSSLPIAPPQMTQRELVAWLAGPNPTPPAPGLGVAAGADLTAGNVGLSSREGALEPAAAASGIDLDGEISQLLNSPVNSPGAPAVSESAPAQRYPVGESQGGGGAVSVVSPVSAEAEVRAMQVHDCYLVVETTDGITVIDQHALHERIMYEHLRRRVLAGGVEIQRLLIPLTLQLSAREAGVLLDQAELLAELGLQIQDFGGGTVALAGVPVMLSRADPQTLLKDLVDLLETSGRKIERRDLLDRLLHMMSCKAAVKAGQRLAPEEIEALLAQRHLCEDAHHCPHGRPTALKLSREELDRQFGRLGS